MSYKGLLLFDRRSWAVTAHAMALGLILAGPVASLAWLGGAHATIEQVALHEEAVEHAHYHHHGALDHDEPEPGGAGELEFQVSRAVFGPVFAAAAASMGPFNDLLQATLSTLEDASSSDKARRGTSAAEAVFSQHIPQIPHRPPVPPTPLTARQK